MTPDVARSPTLDRTFEPLPPHSLEAEEAVLGSLLSDPSAGVEIGDFLRASDFYRPQHRTIYEAILRVAGRGEPPDFLLVSDELARVGEREAIGGDAYLARLLCAVPTSLHIKHYGRIVWRTAIYRRLITAAGRIAALAYDDGPDVAAICQQAEAELLAITRSCAALPRRPLSVLEAHER